MSRSRIQAIACALVMASCRSGQVATSPDPPTNGRNFWIAVGESVLVRPDDLAFGFVSVASDSRCPTGVRCIWIGEATTHMWAAPREGPRAFFDITISGGEARPDHPPLAEVGSHRIELLGLEPYPAAGVPNDPARYRALVRVTRR